MKIYTKTGDDGTTGLFAGGRVSKEHPRICAYGTVDELNANLGMAVALLPDISDSTQHEFTPSTEHGQTKTAEASFVLRLLIDVQSDLFCLGSELATPSPDQHGMQLLPSDSLQKLEMAIDSLEAALEPLKSFILPGGSCAAAQLHVARTICRRAEREVVKLQIEEDCDCRQVLIYLNRLSDLLFVLGRWANHVQGVADTTWESGE